MSDDVAARPEGLPETPRLLSAVSASGVIVAVNSLRLGHAPTDEIPPLYGTNRAAVEGRARDYLTQSHARWMGLRRSKCVSQRDPGRCRSVRLHTNLGVREISLSSRASFDQLGRLMDMRINQQPTGHARRPSANQPTRRSGLSSAAESYDRRGTVREISESLDRVHRSCSQIGLATLLAQVREAPPELVCAALDDLAIAAEKAVGTLRGA